MPPEALTDRSDPARVLAGYLLQAAEGLTGAPDYVPAYQVVAQEQVTVHTQAGDVHCDVVPDVAILALTAWPLSGYCPPRPNALVTRLVAAVDFVALDEARERAGVYAQFVRHAYWGVDVNQGVVLECRAWGAEVSRDSWPRRWDRERVLSLAEPVTIRDSAWYQAPLSVVPPRRWAPPGWDGLVLADVLGIPMVDLPPAR
jgi:hypothetical protein